MGIKSRVGPLVRKGLEISVARKLVGREGLDTYCDRNFVFGDPEQIHTDTIPEFSGHAEYKEDYTVDPPFICEVSDVTMFGPGGTVVAQDGNILFESARNIRADLVKRLVYLLRNPTRLPTLLAGYRHLYVPWLSSGEYDFELAFPVTYPTYAGYYHWVVEYLPKLRILEAYRNETGTDPVVLLDPDPPGWMKESVQLLTDASIVKRPRSPISIRTLVLPSHRNHHPEDFKPSIADYHWLRDQMFDVVDVDDPGSDRRIYISRKDANRRRVVNERAVIQCLEKHGFEAYTLSDLSVREQVRVFADAEQVVAPHGAGLVNMIFSESCEILELIPDDLVFPFYHCLADHLGHEYEYLYCESKNTDICVDIQKLNSSLKCCVE